MFAHIGLYNPSKPVSRILSRNPGAALLVNEREHRMVRMFAKAVASADGVALDCDWTSVLGNQFDAICKTFPVGLQEENRLDVNRYITSLQQGHPENYRSLLLRFIGRMKQAGITRGQVRALAQAMPRRGHIIELLTTFQQNRRCVITSGLYDFVDPLFHDLPPRSGSPALDIFGAELIWNDDGTIHSCQHSSIIGDGDKGRVFLEACCRGGCRPARTIAIGDWRNDKAMWEIGLGILVLPLLSADSDSSEIGRDRLAMVDEMAPFVSAILRSDSFELIVRMRTGHFFL
jgi:hypothetical protein